MSGRRGYMLVEVVTAMAVLSIAAVAIHRAARTAILARGVARDYAVAQHLLESVEADCALQPRLLTGEWNEGVFTPPNTRFSWRWTVEPLELPAPAWLDRVDPERRPALALGLQRQMGRLRIQIAWTRGGEAFQVSGETLIPPGRLWPPPPGAAP